MSGAFGDDETWRKYSEAWGDDSIATMYYNNYGKNKIAKGHMEVRKHLTISNKVIKLR